MKKNGDSVNWGALAGIGSQMLVGVVAGWWVGQWLDKKYGWSPWGVLVGTLVGVAAGMYSLIREGMRANRDTPGRKPPGTGK